MDPYQGKTLGQVLDSQQREQRYQGDSAPIAALCLEMGLEERETIRRIGMGTREFRADWPLGQLLDVISRVIYENRQPKDLHFVRRFVFYSILLAEDRLKFDAAINDKAMEMLITGEFKPQVDWPIGLTSSVARDKANKALGYDQEPSGSWGRPDNQETLLESMVEDAHDLIARGYPIAAWDILATTTLEKRQEALLALSAHGMSPWDWITKIDGFERCLLCSATVEDTGGELKLEHTDHCPQSNLVFGFNQSFWTLPPDRKRGLRLVPVVMGESL